jgi:hypothetical protein
VHFVGLHYISVSQCTLQKTLRCPIISAFNVAEGTFLADVSSTTATYQTTKEGLLYLVEEFLVDMA